MPYVLVMSTDQDIVNTQLAQGWGPVVSRTNWVGVAPGGLNIPAGAEIVVLAHGNNNEIGNAAPGNIDIDAASFLALIYSNMAPGAAPARIYISTCGNNIAGFAGNVALLAQQNHIWAGTWIYGHNVAVAGPVPPPGGVAWTPIYVH